VGALLCVRLYPEGRSFCIQVYPLPTPSCLPHSPLRQYQYLCAFIVIGPSEGVRRTCIVPKQTHSHAYIDACRILDASLTRKTLTLIIVIHRRSRSQRARGCHLPRDGSHRDHLPGCTGIYCACKGTRSHSCCSRIGNEAHEPESARVCAAAMCCLCLMRGAAWSLLTLIGRL
jgi:hypothetical protein